MGDYSDLCELYGINPNDVNGFDKILDIWMDEKKYQVKQFSVLVAVNHYQTVIL